MRRRIDSTTWSDGSTVETDRPRWLAALARHRVPAPIDPEAPPGVTASDVARTTIRIVGWVIVTAALIVRDIAIVLAGLVGAGAGVVRDTYYDIQGD